jgi:hypothetical protein
MVMHRNHYVRRLDVAMDDSLLVRVLYRQANIDKETQSLVRRESLTVTELRDGNAIGCPKMMPAIRAF